ncbi:hypothetical protein RJ639_015907, partial [Escallonia herrerae]
VESSVPDKDGLRHVLLCRVLLGRTELVRPGSGQYHPSSEEFDSGVDNQLSPKKYIVWSSNMNTLILPEYVISFRAPPCLEVCQRIQVPPKKPTSPWMPFSTLISALSKVLPAHSISLIAKHHYCDYRVRTDELHLVNDNKITRHELIQRIRHVAGDKLLTTIIKSKNFISSWTFFLLKQSSPRAGSCGVFIANNLTGGLPLEVNKLTRLTE